MANPAAYKVLVPLHQQSLKEYGVPVIGGCPDLVLDTDGCHWGVSYRNAVRKLADVLVNAALPTASFSKAAPPPLWHWRFDATFRRYYPCCIKCNKLAQDIHLESKDHLRKTAGSFLSFDCPGREHYCAHGVVFWVGGRPYGELETTPFLSADHPVPGGGDFIPAAECAKVSNLSILSECCHKKATNTGLSGQVICRTQWGEQSATEDVFEFVANGSKRDVFCTQLQNFIVKASYVIRQVKNVTRKSGKPTEVFHLFVQFSLRCLAILNLSLHRSGCLSC